MDFQSTPPNVCNHELCGMTRVAHVVNGCGIAIHYEYAYGVQF